MISSVLGLWQQLDELEFILQMQKLDLRNSSVKGHVAHKWQGHDLHSGLRDAHTTPCSRDVDHD